MYSKYKRKQLWRLLITAFAVYCVVLVFLSLQSKNTLTSSRQINFTNEAVTDYPLQGTVIFNAHDNEEVTPVLIEAINNATSSIDIVMYSFNNVRVYQALLRAQSRGVQVTLITDKSSRPSQELLFSIESTFTIIEVGEEHEQASNFMHHKYMLIDANTSAAKLFFGAMNYTDLQEQQDPSFILVVADKHLIESFSSETNLLRSGKRSRAKFGLAYSAAAARTTYTNGWVELWFSPGAQIHSAQLRLLELITSAKSTIDIAAWVATDTTVVQALLQKARQGVRVRVLSDDAYVWSKHSAWRMYANVKAAEPTLPLQLVTDSYNTLLAYEIATITRQAINPFLHQHTAIIDNTYLFTGTNNWSNNGWFYNDESMMATNVDWIVKRFSDWFEITYTKYQPLELSADWELTDLASNPKLSKVTQALIYEEPEQFGKAPVLCWSSNVIENPEATIPKYCRAPKHNTILLSEDLEILASGYLR